MLKSENVATPFTTVTVRVPERVPAASVPPLCPIAIVTVPVKLGTAFPSASVTVTCTAGMVVSGSVVLGCAVKTRCGAGLSDTTDGNHVVGEPKAPPLCGLFEHRADETIYSPSAAITLSTMTPSGVLAYPVGGPRPAGGFDTVTPYASAPVPTAIEPGPTNMYVAPVPKPERDASTGW